MEEVFAKGFLGFNSCACSRSVIKKYNQPHNDMLFFDLFSGHILLCSML